MSRRTRSHLITLLVDIGMINVAFALAYYVRYQLGLLLPVSGAFQASYLAYLPAQAGYTGLMLLFLALDGAYARRRRGSWLSEIYCIVNATTTVGIIQFAVTFFIMPAVYSRGLILEAIVFTIVFLSVARLGLRVIQGQLRRRGHGVDRVLIVGAGEAGRAVMRSLVALPELGYHVVGFVDDDTTKCDIGRFKALGTLDAVGGLLEREKVDEVIITLPWMYQRQIAGLVRTCEQQRVRARVVPDLFQLALNQVDVTDVGGIPLIGIKEATIPRVGRMVKRGLDIGLSFILLIVTAPLMALIALIVTLESPGPALFRQTRIGERGRPFSIFKFRSMRQGAEAEKPRLLALNEADGPLFKIKDDPRLTRFGKVLRRFSLDELPQLFNILVGDMSLVGPRTALPDEVAQYQPWHRQRLEVPQGLTGLWQVSGRSDLTFDEMCLLDIYYIENWSLGLDFSIMLRTIPALFSGGAF